MAEIDLAFIARQLERLVNDVAGLKDDMVVVMAAPGMCCKIPSHPSMACLDRVSVQSK